MNLYQLATEYTDLYDALLATADEDTGEVDVDICAALESVQGSFEEKAISIATVYRMLGNESEKIRREIDRLTALKKHVDREQTRVKDYLATACEMTGTKQLSGVYASISFRKSEQTIIDDENILPKDFLVEKVTYSPDKAKIKAAIKAGQEVQGARLQVKQNIQIR